MEIAQINLYLEILDGSNHSRLEVERAGIRRLLYQPYNKLHHYPVGVGILVGQVDVSSWQIIVSYKSRHDIELHEGRGGEEERAIEGPLCRLPEDVDAVV